MSLSLRVLVAGALATAICAWPTAGSARAGWSAPRKVNGLKATSVSSRLGTFVARFDANRNRFEIGQVNARGMIISPVIVSHVVANENTMQLGLTALAVNGHGDLLLAWETDVENYGPSFVGVAVIRAASRRSVVHRGPSDGASQRMDAALNDGGVGIVVLDGTSVLRMDRSGRFSAKALEFGQTEDAIGPLRMTVGGGFSFTTLRSTEMRYRVLTASAGPDGRFRRPKAELSVRAPLGAAPNLALGISPRGDAAIMWTTSEKHDTILGVWARVRRRGRWLHAHRLGKSGVLTWVTASVGLDGTAAVAFSGGDKVAAALARPHGDLARGRRIARSHDAEDLSSGVAANGVAALAWATRDRVSLYATAASVARPGKRFAPSERISPGLDPAVDVTGTDLFVVTRYRDNLLASKLR